MAKKKQQNGNGGNGQDKNLLMQIEPEELEKLHNKEIAKIQSPRSTLEAYLGQYQHYVMQALPRHMDPEKMLRTILTATVKNPDLLKCSFASIMAVVLECSQLGLYPGRRAHILPFWNKKTKRFEAQLIPDYKGLIDLARQSGLVSRINSHVVWENEPFKIEYGDDERLTHTPLPPSKRGNKRVGAYATAIFKDGTKHTEWLWADEVEGIRDKSPGAKSSISPWNSKTESDVGEMWRKTAVRRLSKYMPESPELQQFQRAIELDNNAFSGIPQGLELDLPVDLQEGSDGSFGMTPEEEAAQSTTKELKEDLVGGKGGNGKATPEQLDQIGALVDKHELTDKLKADRESIMRSVEGLDGDEAGKIIKQLSATPCVIQGLSASLDQMYAAGDGGAI
jgi:recombination protein RecT